MAHKEFEDVITSQSPIGRMMGRIGKSVELGQQVQNLSHKD